MSTEGEGTYRTFFDLSLDLLCIGGTDGYFKELNPAWERTLGFTLSELKARPFIEFVHPEDRRATLAEVAKLATGEHETVSFENRYRAADGSYRWFLWSSSADAEAGLLLAVARDITSRKSAELDVARARDAAERANRTKSQFLANMSHELRTPLNSIIGFANLLKKRAGTVDPKHRTYIERIHANGNHLLTLINEVLDLSKVEAGQLELRKAEVDVPEVLREVRDQLEGRAISEKVLVEEACPEQVKPVWADRDRFKQILINLLGNAIKFSPGGRVVVRAVVREDGAPQRIDIVDNGIGLAPEKHESIFEKFSQAETGTARRFGGTGLGLAIARSLAREMGFEVAVDSELGRGSTFSLILSEAAEPPLHQLPPSPTRQSSHRTRAKATNGEEVLLSAPLVLVIDDEVDSRMLLETVIQDMGARVVGTSTGAEGIRAARALEPDLITLDLMMPEINGWEVLAALKEDPATSAIPVTVVSVVGDENRAALSDSVQVVRKPVAAEELRPLLSARLRKASGTVLVVDDDPDDREILAELIRELGAKVHLAGDGQAALSLLDSVSPDLICLDLQMPVMDGFSFYARMRERVDLTSCPVIIITARDLTESERARVASTAAVVRKGESQAPELRTILSRLLRQPG